MLLATLDLTATPCAPAAIEETTALPPRMQGMLVLPGAGAEPFNAVAVSAAVEDVDDERLPRK
jgi:hypothetical protein